MRVIIIEDEKPAAEGGMAAGLFELTSGEELAGYRHRILGGVDGR